MLPFCNTPGSDSWRPRAQLPLLHGHVAQEQRGLSIMNEKMLPQDYTTSLLLQFNHEKREAQVKWAFCMLMAWGLHVAWRAQWQIQS